MFIEMIPEEFKRVWDSEAALAASTDDKPIIYDSRLFTVAVEPYNEKFPQLHEFLQYCGDGSEEVWLPTNLASCCKMFANMELPEGFTLTDKFCTENVYDMCMMFMNCTFPDSMRLPETFVATHLETGQYLFANCEIPDGMELPKTFILDKDADCTGFLNGAIVGGQECTELVSDKIEIALKLSSIMAVTEGISNLCNLGGK